MIQLFQETSDDSAITSPRRGAALAPAPVTIALVLRQPDSTCRLIKKAPKPRLFLLVSPSSISLTGAQAPAFENERGLPPCCRDDSFHLSVSSNPRSGRARRFSVRGPEAGCESKGFYCNASSSPPLSFNHPIRASGLISRRRDPSPILPCANATAVSASHLRRALR
jgi:hypothetical protein